MCIRDSLHVAEVILHLLHAAHAGEHHHHAGEARRKADGLAGRAAAVQVVENLLRVIGQVGQAAALDRLHDQYRLVVLTACLLYTSQMRRRVLAALTALWGVGFVLVCRAIGAGAGDNALLQWFDFEMCIRDRPWGGG